ncbi:oxidoreductase [Nitrospirillum viridazoti Y2]|uniref:Short-subunit dehydrogenase n=1 Tax=Nitrospirillum amazonense TaxID=28077 RepID=A0A560IBI5_9PROT|nr:SDR family oxidoreductase [Nitrospirillum amazonense]EGY01612.1 oxidoreductase [Nitrospirillum amazonense Y2]TWB56406.1 short-subunit dehydrogenase [Nitrospirillum amazonense]
MSPSNPSTPAKTVLITGCSSGFGETAARLFAARGWNVIATMRDPARDPGLAALDTVQVVRLDVQDRDSIAAAVEAGLRRFGRIDTLVNNAGFGLFGVFEATPVAKITEQFEVNVFGVMDVTRAILPHFRANGAGTIINISSGAGAFGLPLMSLYCASKFALEGYSEALSFELASVGVTVKLVEPGGVTSTNFGPRSGTEAGGQADLADYRPFVAKLDAFFEGWRNSLAGTTPDGVAEVIYTAATDGTDQLRYVATDDIKPLIAARRETSEEAYMAMMREHFMPK